MKFPPIEEEENFTSSTAPNSSTAESTPNSTSTSDNSSTNTTGKARGKGKADESLSNLVKVDLVAELTVLDLPQPSQARTTLSIEKYVTTRTRCPRIYCECLSCKYIPQVYFQCFV